MRFEDKQWFICNTLHRNLKNEQHEIHNKPGEIRGSGIVSYSNSMGEIRCSGIVSYSSSMGEIRGSGIVSYSNSMDETVFLDKYWKFSTINTDQDPLKIRNFFVKNAYLNPDRNHKL